MDDTQLPSEPDQAKAKDLLWQMMWHEDGLLATRVSVFLVAESILVAVAATLVNTVAGTSHAVKSNVRGELFGITISIGLVGLALTLVFWYVMTLNFDNVGALMDDLKTRPALGYLISESSDAVGVGISEFYSARKA